MEQGWVELPQANPDGTPHRVEWNGRPLYLRVNGVEVIVERRDDPVVPGPELVLHAVEDAVRRLTAPDTESPGRWVKPKPERVGIRFFDA